MPPSRFAPGRPASRPSSWAAQRVRWLPILGLAVGMAALLSGCISQYPQTIFEPHSEYADEAYWLLELIFWPALLVFFVVEGWLVYTIVRYRQRPGQARPEQIHGNTRIEIAWTIAPAVVLAFIAVPTVRTIFVTQADVAPGALQVTVTGHQWWWEFEYPELGIVTANEFWLPVGTTAGFTELSADVIHSFWVPAMGGKRDVVPNHDNKMWFTPRTAGEYLGQCGEFCGDSHADMRLRLHTVSKAEFDAWVQHMKTPSGAPAADASDEVKKGAQLVGQYGCVGCHTIDGNPLNANARVGPNLSHVASRTTFAAGILPTNAENVARWVHDAPSVKQGSKMPSFADRMSDADAKAIAAYVLTLK